MSDEARKALINLSPTISEMIFAHQSHLNSQYKQHVITMQWMYTLLEVPDFKKIISLSRKGSIFFLKEKEGLSIVMEFCINKIDPEVICFFCLNVLSTWFPYLTDQHGYLHCWGFNASHLIKDSSLELAVLLPINNLLDVHMAALSSPIRFQLKYSLLTDNFPDHLCLFGNQNCSTRKPNIQWLKSNWS